MITPDELDAVIRARLDAVAASSWLELDALVDTLATAAGSAVEWQAPEPRVELIDGVATQVLGFAHPVLPAAARGAVEFLHRECLVVPFDWQAWVRGCRDLPGDSDPVTAVKYLTATVRTDRFDDGALAAAVESGAFAAALRSLRPTGALSPGSVR